MERHPLSLKWAHIMLATLTLFFFSYDIQPDEPELVRHGDYTYGDSVAHGVYEGYGEMRYKDSIVYAGQWKADKREGMGVSYDAHGRRIAGEWKADMLMYGTRTDADGTYHGQLNQESLAESAGTYQSRDSTYYHGYWRDDQRWGFDFSSSSKKLRLGRWKVGRYLGERLVYVDQRIYGIDTSRHQHDIGKKHYPVHQNKLHIMHLDTISKERIRGTASCPISFYYIKSTEGTTVRNRYFMSDYRTAKRRGIHCGAHHFFSTRTSGKAQITYFIRHTRFEKGDLPPVLDVEPFPSQAKRMGGTKTLFTEVRARLQTVERRVGVKPILYISQTFVSKYLPSAPELMGNYNVWIARYSEYKPDVYLVVWQLSPDGRVNGIKGDVDINVFNGYQDHYEGFLQNERIK